MGFIASDIGRIPDSSDFNWYVFLLQDGWNNELQEEINQNFAKLAREIGPNALVVKGSDPESFYDQVFYEYALEDRGVDGTMFPLPALLITDLPPIRIKEDRDRILSSKMILISLAKNYSRPGSVTDILRRVAAALRESDVKQSLEGINPETIAKRWGWIPRYFDLKPNFFGFGVDIDAILEDLIKKDS